MDATAQFAPPLVGAPINLWNFAWAALAFAVDGGGDRRR